jgi:hypothetical protein
MGRRGMYKPKDKSFSGWLLPITFETSEEAQMVCQLFDRHIIEGREVRVGLSKPPMEQLGPSWDSGKPRIHYTARDQGSAVGTNPEKVSVITSSNIVGTPGLSTYYMACRSKRIYTGSGF